ncbi:MAG: ATP-binding protein, partial [Myxococcales bacterium]|nr:ATP-binding protein [Myxococcales bacterium]
LVGTTGTVPLSVRPMRVENAATRAVVGGEGLSARQDGAPEPAPLVRELIGVPIPPPALRDAGLGLWRHRPPQYTSRMPQRVRLWQRLEHAVRDDAVRLVALRGPLGSGRTRTARWLLEAARVNGGVHAVMATAGTSGDALRDVLRDVLRGMPGDPDGLANARWMLEHHGLTYRVVVDAVEQWFASPDDAERLRHAVVEVVRSLARGRPVILVLDDADRDPEMVEVARELLDGPAAPLLVVATCEDALDPAFQEVPTLDPLRRREMSQLLASVLPLSIPSMAEVVAGSGGLPGRALELVHALFDRGHYTYGPGGITLDLEPDPPRPLPDVPPAIRDVLRRAALLGVFPDRRVVAQSFGNQKRAEKALERSAALGLIAIHGSVISFEPGLRKAVLAAEDASWTRHHTALARTLPPESPDGALHRIRGGEKVAGFEQLVGAIRALDQGGELLRMLDHCERGLELWEAVVGPPREGPWEYLALKRAEVLAALRSERLEDVLEHDLAVARVRPIRDAVAGLLVERAALDRQGASRDLHFALEAAETDAIRARALHGLARLAERRNDVPLSRYWLLAVSKMVASADREAAAHARVARARLASMDEDYARAAAEIEAAIRHRGVPGDLDLLAAGVSLAMGNHVQARSSLLRGVHWMSLRHDRRWLPTALVRLGLVELLEGNQDLCEARLAEADRIRAENRRRFGADPSLAASVRLVLCLERGEWFRAMEALGHCPDLAWRRPTRVAVMARVQELLDSRRDMPEPVREALERSMESFVALRGAWLTR